MSDRKVNVLHIGAIPGLVLAIMLAGQAAGSEDHKDYYGLVGVEGDRSAVLTKMNGEFYLRRSAAAGLGDNVNGGFNIYNDVSLRWYNEEGYYPSLVTEFERDDCTVKLKLFCDKVTINAKDFSLLYIRVSVYNHGTGSVNLSPGLWASGPNQNIAILHSDSTAVPPGVTHRHDYVTYADRFDVESWSWPSTSDMMSAGSLDSHYDHMKSMWDSRLSGLVSLTTPDIEVNNAIKAGVIYSLIIRDYTNYNTGARGVNIPVSENAYEDEYNHDIVGINAAIVMYGALDSDMKAALRDTPKGGGYPDGLYKYDWLYSLYRLKSGDQAFIDMYWSDIEYMARNAIGTRRTGINGTMEWSWGPDYWGYWTADSWAALAGLQGYKYLAQKSNKPGEVTWANDTFVDLRGRVNTQINSLYTDHISESLEVHSDTPGQTVFSGDNLKNVNHAHHLLMSRFLWEAVKYEVDMGQSPERIDATYAWHLGRCQSRGLPEWTMGGFNGDNYSTGYNTGYFGQALAGAGSYRMGPIRSLQFMIENTQCAPYAWWEGIQSPSPSLWEGSHPTGSGGCPHGWGNSMTLYYVLESLIAEKFSGTVIIGRGLPNEWIEDGQSVTVDNAPITDGRRMGYELVSYGNSIDITFTGDDPVGDIQIELPIFLTRLSSTSTGTVDFAAGRVTVPGDTDQVTITLVPLVQDPVISPDDGVYANQVEVTIHVDDPVDAEIRYTQDGTDPTSGSALYSGPILLTEPETTVKAIGMKSGYLDSDIVTRQYMVGSSGDGLLGEYYSNHSLSGNPALMRFDPEVNFGWELERPDPRLPADDFSVRWSGYVKPLYEELYTFHTYTDDGIRLWVDGQQLIDKWVDQGPTEWTGQIALSAGQNYPIVMEYYENNGGARAELYWSSTSQIEQIIPQSQLSPVDAPVDPPPAPSNLTAAAVSSDQINLNWFDHADNESGFRIERRTTGDFSLLGSTPANTTSYMDIGLNYETTYTYRVYAYNAAGNSVYCNEALSTTHSPPPPPPPVDLAAVEGDGCVTLSWTAPAVADPPVLYSMVYRSEDAGATYRLVAVAFGGTGIIDKQVVNDVEYCYRLKAVNNRGQMSDVYSQVICALPHVPPPPPSPPVDLLATASQEDNEILLTWTDTGSMEDGFILERRMAGDYEVIADLPVETTGHIDTGLEWFTTYTYRIKAYNAGGESGYSNESSDTTPEPMNPEYLIVDDIYNGITYTGSWGFHDDWVDRYNGTTHESDEVGASAEYVFTGFEIELIGEIQGWGGNAEIFIDDASYGQVSFNGSSAIQQSIVKIINLAYGQHTLKLVNVDGGWIYVDALISTHY